ncbi:hypothetical protein GOBAR_DD16999 [Gossypium barbadense]|nr:hypothetical protein GOBAR_DD16999 [Gossypium barbadense]
MGEILRMFQEANILWGCSHWNPFIHLEDVVAQVGPFGDTTTNDTSSEGASNSSSDNVTDFNASHDKRKGTVIE